MTTESEQAAAIVRMADAVAQNLTKTAAHAAAAVTATAVDAGAALTPVLVAIGKIETKLDIYIEQQGRHQSATDQSLKEVWVAIDHMRSGMDKSTGFFDGAKFILGLLLSLPVGVAGMLLQSAR